MEEATMDYKVSGKMEEAFYKLIEEVLPLLKTEEGRASFLQVDQHHPQRPASGQALDPRGVQGRSHRAGGDEGSPLRRLYGFFL